MEHGFIIFHENIKSNNWLKNLTRLITQRATESNYFHVDIGFFGDSKVAKKLKLTDSFDGEIKEGGFYMSSGEKTGYSLHSWEHFLKKKAKEKFTGKLYFIPYLMDTTATYEDFKGLRSNDKLYTVVGAVFSFIEDLFRKVGIDVVKVFNFFGYDLGKVYDSKMFCSVMSFITWATGWVSEDGKKKFARINKTFAMLLSPANLAKYARKELQNEQTLAVFVKGKLVIEYFNNLP